MSVFRLLFTKYLLPILSGLLIGTSYIPLPPWALLFCMVPLWIFWMSPERSLREVIIGGWITQFVLTLIGFHWIAYTAHEFGHFPWPVALLILLLFCMLAHLYIPAAGALWFLIRRRLKLGLFASLFSLALMAALFETFWPSIFRWNLGYPLIWAGLPMYQLADIIGFQGLSTLIYLFNAGFAWLWFNRKNQSLLIRYGTLILLLFIAANIAGTLRVRPWRNPDQSLSLLQVQGNIGNLQKQYAERGAGYQQHILDTYMKLTRQGLSENPDTELIIWPETAFPGLLDDRFAHDYYSRQFREFVSEIKTPLFTGSYSRDPENPNSDEPNRSYNAVFLFGEDALLLDRPYRKTHLLAFGEYFPGRQWVPAVEEWFPMVSNFGRGDGPKIIDYHGIELGSQICYEGLYPNFSRELTNLGAKIFVNVTNDSWFGQHFEPYQHLYMTLARAIENRRPLIRNTNTGISTVVLADGEVLLKSPIGEEWTAGYEVRYYSNPEYTFYTLYGSWWTPLWFVLLLIIILMDKYRARIDQP